MGFFNTKFVFRSASIVSYLSISAAFSQSPSRAIVTQPTEWFALNSNIKLHKKFGFAFDGQLRLVQGFESSQHYVRNGLEIYVTPKLSIVPIGYMYVRNFQYGKQPALFVNNEQRIWQQIIYRHNYRNLFFAHRFRFEERFVQKHHAGPDGMVVNDGYETFLKRIRYRLQVQIPLNKEKIEPGTWFVGIFDELFYSWGTPITFHKPDQNRIYTAIGYQFSKKFSIQGGAFYQLLIKKNGAQQENNVGTLIQVGYNLDFSKSEN
jgi:hypothetical protein